MLSKEYVDKIFKKFVTLSNKDTFKIFYEDGTVTDYQIMLNYSIEGRVLRKNDNSPILMISDYNLFIDYLTALLNKMYDFCYGDKDYFEYNEDNYNLYLIMCCFLNMQETDFNYPIQYFDRLTKSFDIEYNFGSETLLGSFTLNGETIEIYEENKKNKATLEAFQSKKLKLKRGSDQFLLPKIHYYISGDAVYITGIQNNKKQEKTDFSKTIDRYFRKLDKGIDETPSENGEVNNIKDISPNALAALVFFIASNSEYTTFYMTDYLPLRYQNKLGNIKNEDDLNEINRIQKNATNRFLMTGARLCHHFQNWEYNFFNGIQRIYVKESNKSSREDNIIYDLYESIQPHKKR